MVGILTDELDEFVTHLESRPTTSCFPRSCDFNELIESTPSLKAARADMIDRLAQLAAEAMAARAGVDPERSRAPDCGGRARSAFGESSTAPS